MEADGLDRTLKLELDEGRARSREDALRLVGTYRLTVHAGPAAMSSRTTTAALLTMLATAVRCFAGGVDLIGSPDWTVDFGPWRGRTLGEAAVGLGFRLTEDAVDGVPAITLCADRAVVGAIHATWQGWAGGVVSRAQARLAEDDRQPLAGVLAGALAVSEAFQAIRGSPYAARRDTGVSLWRPGLHWMDDAALGPALEVLPQALWLLGLGHLGQAYAWGLGYLPYQEFQDLTVGLVDPDVIVRANVATGLLSDASTIGRTKARVVADVLARLGAKTLVVERRFSDRFQVDDGEPRVAFAGFDDPRPRRVLEDAGFLRSVDAGLGGGPQYLDAAIHTFPSQYPAATSFPDRSAAERSSHVARLLEAPAWATEVERLQQRGMSVEAAGCGLVDVVGRTVGASFVGAAVSTLVLSEELRALHGGPRYGLVDLSLSDPTAVGAVMDEVSRPAANPGYVRAQPSVMG